MRYEPSKRVPSYFPKEGSPSLAFVAQSPGAEELKQGLPLVGASGRLLKECADKAGIDWYSCYRGNLIEFKPPSNDFSFFCGKKAEVGGKEYRLPPIASGQYLKPEWFDELRRLMLELEEIKPNVIVTVGNEALWALTFLSGITKYRGAVTESKNIPGQKILPTWHPAAVLRKYDLKLDLTLDLFKAKSESEFPEIRHVHREISIYPEVHELWAWEEMHAPGPDALCSVDIETGHGQVTCIGFAFDKHSALVVPFWSDLRDGHSYWRDLSDELEAWRFVEHMLSTYPVLGQNFYAYDLWFLLKEMGLVTRRLREDTMIQHHAHMPELAKKLGYLSSIYLNIPAYKTLRPRGQKAEKRDE